MARHLQSVKFTVSPNSKPEKIVFWFFGGRLVARRRLVRHAWFPSGYKIYLSVPVGRACLRHERRKDPKIKPVKAILAQSKPRGGPRKTAAIIGKRPVDTHDNDPRAVDGEPRKF